MKRSKEDVEKIIRMHEEGVPNVVIAKAFGITPGGVGYHLRKVGLTKISISTCPKDVKYVESCYGMRTETVAADVGCSVDTIRRIWKSKFGKMPDRRKNR